LGLEETIGGKGRRIGARYNRIIILDPDRFKNDHDGPCHSPEERILFWKDVLMSLHLSQETLFREARNLNEERRQYDPENYIADLEERIIQIINRNQL
jgi:hypothetical protein